MPVPVILALVAAGAVALPPAGATGQPCLAYGSGDPRPDCRTVQNHYQDGQRELRTARPAPSPDGWTAQQKIDQANSQANQVR